MALMQLSGAQRRECWGFAEGMHPMFSVQSGICGEGTLQGWRFPCWESHVWRTEVVLICGGWGSKLIVRQTGRSAISNLGLFLLAKSQLCLRMFSWDTFVFIGLLKAWKSCSLMYILIFCDSQALCIMNILHHMSSTTMKMLVPVQKFCCLLLT